jgi:hypothetical protein
MRGHLQPGKTQMSACGYTLVLQHVISRHCGVKEAPPPVHVQHVKSIQQAVHKPRGAGTQECGSGVEELWFLSESLHKLSLDA